MPNRSFVRLLMPVASGAFFFLAGCALQSTAPSTLQSTAAFQGRLQGGQQPIVGAAVYLYAANTTGYGGKGIAASSGNASVSLLTSAVLTNNPGKSGQDGNGKYYVTTDSKGFFSITGDYTCTAGQQLYMYAVGGNPGAGTNANAGLLAALGDCSTVTASTYIWMNEISTVAAAYALAGFASDATHVSSSGTALAKVGIANAFKNAANLATLGTGVAVQTSGNLTAPYRQVNTLANILAACVNTTGASSAPCSTLLTAATSTGASGGTMAGDTATAAIYIAQNPAANVLTLWGVPAPTAPFGPALTGQPTDWILALTFTGGGMNNPVSLAIDDAGKVWVGNLNGKSISGFSPQGVDLSTGSGFADPNTSAPRALAIDTSHNIWVASGNTPGRLSEFSSTGVLLNSFPSSTNVDGAQFMAFDSLYQIWITHGSTAITSYPTLFGTGVNYSIAGLNSYGIAVDRSSNVWVTDYESGGYAGRLSYPGVINTKTTGGLDYPNAVALDSSGNLWVTSGDGNFGLAKFGTNQALITSTSSGGLRYPSSLAIDGAGYVWVGNSIGVSEFDSSVAAITTTSAFTGGLSLYSQSIALDGSGDVWMLNSNSQLVEFVGAATPVVTPVVANINPPYNLAASKP